MKDVYINFENAPKKTNEWMKKLLPLRERHKDFVFEPKDSALLVIDMQRYFIDIDGGGFVPVGKFILFQIRKLVKEYYANNLPVIFTRYGVIKKAPEDMMNKWWGEVLLTDNPQSLVVDDLDTKRAEVIIKPGYSAFFKTKLDSLLQSKDVKQLVICGVLTHLCCETTARDAFQRCYEVYFTIDGTGTYNEKIHTTTLFNLSHGFVVPVTVKEILHNLMKI